MAQITIDTESVHPAPAPVEHDDRLRTVLPVAVSVTALFGVVLGFGLAMRELVGVGVWLVGG